MPSHEQVKHALRHSKEFRQLIPDLATLRAAMVHVDLRVKLFDHLLKHPKTLRQLVKNQQDFDELFKIDRDYLQTPECNDITYQGFFFEQLIEDIVLLDKVIKDRSDLNYIAYLIRFAPISEERKANFRLQIIEKVMTIENKFLDLFHPKLDPADETSRDYDDHHLAHDRHSWSAAIMLLSKMEVEQVFPIFFKQFRNNDFRRHDTFIGTLEDMRIRWSTFDKATYKFCVTQILAILDLPTMKDPTYRNNLVGYLEDCEKTRPKNMASLLSAELQHKLKTDPCFELYRNVEDVSLLIASQQKSGLLKSVASSEVTGASICREPSPKPTGSPVTVKSS